MSFTLHNSTQLGFGRMLRAGQGVFDNPQITPTITNGSLSLAINPAFLGAYYTTSPTITVTDRGTGTTSAPPVVTATATAAISAAGTITATTLTAGGHYYSSVPAVTVGTVPGASGASIVATVVAGAVATLIIANAGTAYTAIPTLTIAAPPPVIQPGATLPLAGGYVYKLTLGGTNTSYTATPTVSFTGGGGQGAAAIANMDLTAGKVIDFTVTNTGYGYTSAPTAAVSAVAGANVATATAVIASQLGAPTSVTGFGYTSVPYTSVTGPQCLVINAPAYGTILSPGSTKMLGIHGSDEQVSWLWPSTLVNSTTQRRTVAIPLTNNVPIIVLERTATTLTVNLEVSQEWIDAQ